MSRNKIIAEAYRLSEKKLETQMNLAISSDQRAVTFSGILIAAVAIQVSLSTTGEIDIYNNLAIVFFVLAAGFSAFVARSTKITATGMKFSDFEDDIKDSRSYEDAISQLGAHYDDALGENLRLITMNGRLFNVSLIFAACGLVLTVLPRLKLLICNI